ncbi:MAG: hypothetical protein GX043_00700 [Desulfovibrionales bacterium]|nr:hypothetical protein [Desulfovibrionales bacterium]
MNTNKKSDVEIFVHNRTVVSFSCPHCKLEKSIDISKIKNVTHWNIKATCTRCKNDFTVSFNLRKYFRKKTDLSATLYKTLKFNDYLGDAQVTDMSLSGIGFTTKENISKHNVLAIRFVLDNNENTEVCKEIKIESIRDDKIGASFIDGIVLDKDFRNYIVNQ